MGRAFELRKGRKMKRWAVMSKTFTRIGKDIVMAIKEGGSDPESNSKLRAVIQNAKTANMPKDNIERAIKKASDKDTSNYKEALFEEIHYQTFVFERLLGLTIFPLVLLAIYSPFNPTLIIEMVLIFVAAVLLFKWLRMLYLSFFSLTISKTHIIVYLCALEFLPLLIMLKIMHNA